MSTSTDRERLQQWWDDLSPQRRDTITSTVLVREFYRPGSLLVVAIGWLLSTAVMAWSAATCRNRTAGAIVCTIVWLVVTAALAGVIAWHRHRLRTTDEATWTDVRKHDCLERLTKEKP